MKKQSILHLLFVAATAALILNCTVSDSDDGGGSLNLTSTALFPFQNNTNWWRYTDSGAHTLFISVLDTITDNGTIYFKVSFAEKGIDTTDNWFRKSSLGVEYSPYLTTPFFVFLPPAFTTKQGSFSSAGSTASYSYMDSLLVNGKYRKQVMQVSYPTAAKIHGFDEIDFSSSLGIVRLIDNGDRFPVVYELDSARINGVIYR